MKLQVKFRAEALHHTYCRYFRTNLLMFWWTVFDCINIHRTAIYRKILYRGFLHNDHLPYFPVTSVRKFLWNVISFTIFHLSEAATEGVLLEKVFLEISQKGKHLWQSLFFNKVAGWGDCFWSFLCLPLKISCIFHFNRKMKWKREIPWWSSNIYFFAPVSICLTSKISKGIWQMFKGNLMLQFLRLEEFC